MASKAEDEAQTEIARTRNFFEVAEDLKQTPVESSLFDKKLEEIMKRSKSPIRTISTFLQGYGEGKFTGASKAMRAAEAQYDNMEMDLLKLQQANRISEQQFDINMQKIANEKEQLRIMEDNNKRRAKISEQYNTLMSTYYTRASDASNAGNRIELASAISDARNDFNAMGSGLKEAFIREVAINATRSPDGSMLNTRQLEDYIEDNEAALAAQAEDLFLRTTFQGLYRPNTGMAPRGAGSVGPSIESPLQSEAIAIMSGE